MKELDQETPRLLGLIQQGMQSILPGIRMEAIYNQSELKKSSSPRILRMLTLMAPSFLDRCVLVKRLADLEMAERRSAQDSQ